jgi:hypothetical protein
LALFAGARAAAVRQNEWRIFACLQHANSQQLVNQADSSAGDLHATGSKQPALGRLAAVSAHAWRFRFPCKGAGLGGATMKPAAVVVVPGHVGGVRRSIAGERALCGEIGGGQATAKRAASWCAS